MSTVYSKNRYGHSAETTVELENKRLLKISTSKSTISRRLQTTATVHTRDGGALVHKFAFGSRNGDFSKRMCSQETRVTEKAVREQHQQALAQLKGILQEVQDHYAAPQQEAVDA